MNKLVELDNIAKTFNEREEDKVKKKELRTIRGKLTKNYRKQRKNTNSYEKLLNLAKEYEKCRKLTEKLRKTTKHVGKLTKKLQY